MWPTIFFQCLTCGVVGVSLFFKQSPDFDSLTSYGLMGLAITSSALSIYMFVKEEKEGKRLKRNVENIVRSMTLNDFIYSAISSAFSKHGPAGYPLMRNLRTEGGTQYFSYYEEDERTMGGVIYAHRYEMNHFAMYDESEISDEIANFVNQKMNGGVSENWNELCDEFSTGAQYVVADRGMNPAICQRVWANSDTQTLGLVTDPAKTKPDYVVDATILSELVGMTRRERQSRFVTLFEKHLDHKDRPAH